MRPRARPTLLKPLVPQLLLAVLGLAVFFALFPSMLPPSALPRTARLRRVEGCALRNFHAGDDLAFLGSVALIAADEILDRRDRLARALVAAGVDAFVAEPGNTFQYFTSVSRAEWDRYGPGAGPVLMVIVPRMIADGLVTSETVFLVPKYEEAHAQNTLNTSPSPAGIITWTGEQNPYEVLLNSSGLFTEPSSSTAGRSSEWSGESPRVSVMLDAELRNFVARGLADAGFRTVALTREVVRLGQIKTFAEVDILRAADTATARAIRAVRPCLSPGLTEDDVQDVLGATLEAAGLRRGFEVVMFEENGAMPHGGATTGGKTIKADSMVTIIASAHLMGYSSAITRSFLLDPPKPLWPLLIDPAGYIGILTALPGIPLTPDIDYDLLKEKLKSWDVLSDAQTAAAAALQENQSVAMAERAGRKVIEDAGYRVSSPDWLEYGIGIKFRGAPSQIGLGNETMLQAGMVVDMNLGIHVDGKYGISSQDGYLITETGQVRLLAENPAEGPYHP